MSFYKVLEVAYSLPTFSEEEWESKVLSKVTQKRLGLRSPKLSKVLASYGVPEKVSQYVLSKTKEKSYLSSAILEQGDSIHFLSCQARNPLSKWIQMKCKSLWKEGDIEAHASGHLLMWVAGQPMSKDGSGFKARAKVRTVHSPRDSSLMGVYVDLVYGQHELLQDKDLLELLFEKFGREVPILVKEEGVKGVKGVEGIVPSAAFGYQDTLFGGGPFFFRKKKEMLYELLTQRLATPLWRRQSYKDVLEKVKPPEEPKWRGPRPPKEVLRIKKFLGLPKEWKVYKATGCGWIFKSETSNYILYQTELGWTFRGLGLYEGAPSRDGMDLACKSPGKFVVRCDFPLLGMAKAVPIPKV